MDDLLNIFDSWGETIEKARKNKGLDKWKKLESIAGKLSGKQAKDITFTCSHPSHQGEPVKHVLGSSSGNLHWLQGYGNPAFHLAPYHWNVIDPNLDESSIKEFDHPARPEFWSASGLPLEEEGDLEEGKPHPSVSSKSATAKRAKEIREESVEASDTYATYVGVPSMGLVYGKHNRQTYQWTLIKNSYFAAVNPDFAEAMNKHETELEDPFSAELNKSLPDTVLESLVTSPFSEDVYHLIKKSLPLPGSLLELRTSNDKPMYGVVNSDSISFFDGKGTPSSIIIHDQAIKSLDLRRNGESHPGVIANFLLKYLNIDLPEVQEAPFVVEGTPTLFNDESPTREIKKTKDGWRRL